MARAWKKISLIGAAMMLVATLGGGNCFADKKLVKMTEIKPCKPGYERNLETNRCRKIEPPYTIPEPCPAGQYRNPFTRRCKKIPPEGGEIPKENKGPKPCKPGYERNPETNRCRKVRQEEGKDSEPKPCPVGQERNPATGRCKKIKEAGTPIKPCPAGQIRNPETNRCRKIANGNAGPKPCKIGYERNPETNRCRKIAIDEEAAQDDTQPEKTEEGDRDGDDDGGKASDDKENENGKETLGEDGKLGMTTGMISTDEATKDVKNRKPCKPGYERNPDTNRCRKVKAEKKNDGAPFPIEILEQNPEKAFVATAAIIGITAGGVSYIVWQFRSEIKDGIEKMLQMISKPKTQP